MHGLKNSIRSCRLTTFGFLELVTLKNKFLKKSKTIEKSPKNTKKLKAPRTTPSGSLSAALSTTGVALSLTGPGIIVGASLAAVLTNLSKNLGLKLTKDTKIF